MTSYSLLGRSVMTALWGGVRVARLGQRNLSQSGNPAAEIRMNGSAVQSVQCVYMTLKKVDLLAWSDYDWIIKMHVNTLIWNEDP